MQNTMQQFFSWETERRFDLEFATSKSLLASPDVIEYVKEIADFDASEVIEYAMSLPVSKLQSKDIPQLSNIDDAVIRVCAILSKREKRQYQATEIGALLLGNEKIRKSNAIARYGSDHTVFPCQLGILTRGVGGYYNSAIGSTISVITDVYGGNVWTRLISKLILRLPVVRAVLRGGVLNGVRARDVVATAVNGRTIIRRMATLRRVFDFLVESSDDKTNIIISKLDLNN